MLVTIKKSFPTDGVGISASADPVSIFTLAKVHLLRVALPLELLGAAGNKRANAPLVIVKNKKRLGYIPSTDYYPKGIVISGGMTRGTLLRNGELCAYAWVENGSIDINADDAIGCNELMSLLSGLLQPRSGMMADKWITEVYPFENYFIFCSDGGKFRQHYNLDPIGRKAALVGTPVQVKPAFVNAASRFPELSQTPVDTAFAIGNGERMRPTDNGARFQVSQVRKSDQITNNGASNSELVTMIVRNWADVDESIAMYLNAIKNGGYIPAKFAPVTLTKDHKINAALQAANISSAVDFAIWSAEAFDKKTKTHGGTEVPMAKHAYVGDPKDPSTWHLPIDTPGRARNALARLNQTQGIPKSARPKVMMKIRRAAKKHGIDVSEHASPKQKSWEKKGAAEACVN